MKPATKRSRAVPNKRKPSKKQREKQTKAVPPSLPSSSTKSITTVKKNKNIKTKVITELKPPSSPYTVSLPQTTKPILPSSFSPSTPSKKELSRLGGLRPVLKLLSSRKSSLSQTAALVLSNCTGEDRRICRSLIALQDADSMDNNSDSQQQHNNDDDDDDTHEGLGPLIEHLTDSDATVALHVAKTLAHCTAACQDRDATLHLSSVLRRLGGTRLLIGCLSPLPQHEKITAAVLLSLGNLCCDDILLCDEMRDLGALESLLLLLRPGRPLVLRDRATSTLLNCVEGTEETSQSDMEKELISIGAVSALSRAIETLIDGRKPKTLTSTLSKTITPDTTSSMNTMLRATEPMTCGLLDLLYKCCSKKDKIGANGCDELHDCGGVQLMMILLDDTRQSVKEKACRLLACVCGSAGRNARDIKRSVWSNSNGALEQLVGLVEHRRKTMAKGARRCLDALRNRNTLQNELNTIHRKSSGALTKLTENIRHENSKTSNIGSPAGSAEGKNKNLSDDEVLLPLIEQGIVPIFHRMATEKETLDIKDLEPSVPTSDSSIETKKKLNKKKSKSKKKNVKMTKAETKAAKEKVRKTLSKGFAADYLAWLEIAVCGGKQGGSSTFRVLLRTLCMNGNEELRGHVAIALVILCFQNEILRKSFVQEGAFDATLSMLRTDVGRSHALEFLYTMEPIVRTCVEAIELAKDKMGAALTNPYAAAAAGKWKQITETLTAGLKTTFSFFFPSFFICFLTSFLSFSLSFFVSFLFLLLFLFFVAVYTHIYI